MSNKTVQVKITSAVCIDGKIVVPGKKPIIPTDLAQNLKSRGKCEIIETPEDEAAEDDAASSDEKKTAKK